MCYNKNESNIKDLNKVSLLIILLKLPKTCANHPRQRWKNEISCFTTQFPFRQMCTIRLLKSTCEKIVAILLDISGWNYWTKLIFRYKISNLKKVFVTTFLLYIETWWVLKKFKYYHLFISDTLYIKDVFITSYVMFFNTIRASTFSNR